MIALLKYQLRIYFLINLLRLVYLLSSTSVMKDCFVPSLIFLSDHFTSIQTIQLILFFPTICSSLCQAFTFALRTAILIFLFLLLMLLRSIFFIPRIARLFISICQNLFYISTTIFVFLLTITLFIFISSSLFHHHLFYLLANVMFHKIRGYL